MRPSPGHLARLLLAMTLIATLFAVQQHATPALAAGSTTTSFFLLTTDNRIAALTDALPDKPSTPVAIGITDLNAGETLVDIDVRPQNQLLYGLGVDAAANTATLYLINPQNGKATAIGTAPGLIAFTTDGTTPVDLPDPAIVGYGFDFNPAADRVRVVAGGLNFRLNPNTGAAVDGDNGGGVTTGINPDGQTDTGTTNVDGAAYTNSAPNASATTLYTLDSTSNSLFIQNPANAGTQTLGQIVTLNGSTLDFAKPNGFDIPPGVNVAASGTPVTSGASFAMLTVGGVVGLYKINLVNAMATFIGTPGNLSIRGMAVWSPVPSGIALSADGTNLMRFGLASPGTTSTIAITGIAATETLVGIDGRPATGQLYGLGVNATADAATLYLLDPQTGGATAIGTTGQIAFAGVDLPDPATSGYGFDFNPMVDRLRVVTGTGLNFRVNPNTGLPAAATTDTAITGLPGGSTGVAAAAYTNNYAGAAATTLYTIDPTSNELFIQNPANAGTQTNGLPLTLGGAPLDATGVNGFDIPPGASVATSGAVASGNGYAALTVAGTAGLYQINLATGAATSLGTVGVGTPDVGGFVAWSEAPIAQLGSSTPTVNENAGTVSLTVTSLGGAPMIASYTLGSGDATPGDDYTVISGTLLLGGSAPSQTLVIPIIDDGASEFDETFDVQLPGVDGVAQTLTLTIHDNDPMVEFDSATYSGSEISGTAQLTVILEASSPTSATVQYATVDDTAHAGSDYTAISGTLTFAPGETSKTLNVPILGDQVIDAGEAFTVTLRDPVGAVLCSVIDARVTITDDKAFSTARLSAASYNGSEAGGAALLTVTLDQAAATTTSVHYATSNGTAIAGSDYTASSGTLTFAPGQTSKTLSVPLLADQVVDPGETFTVSLSAPVGVALGTPSSAQVTIADSLPRYKVFLPMIKK